MSKRLIDLTLPLHDGMTTFPGHWHPVTEIVQIGRLAVEGRASRRIVVGSHTGTHVDSPSHFVENGGTIDEIPLDVLIGPATLVKFPDCEPNRKITVDDIRSQIGSRDDVTRVILRYDWSDRWGDASYYAHSPFLAREACEYLVQLGVKLVGQDTPSPDDPRDSAASGCDSPNHKTLLRAGVVNVEYLTNLRAIRGREIEFVALPLKIRGGDGSPARCIAIEDAD